MSRIEVEREIDRYHLHSSIQWASLVLSLLPFVIDMGVIAGQTVLGRFSELVLPLAIIALVGPTFVLPLGLIGSMHRRIGLLSEAMLEKDIGLYVSIGEHRRKLRINKKYLPFDRIDRLYLNGDTFSATVVSKDGVAVALSKIDLPSLESFEEKWGDRIDFIKDKYYLWYRKGSHEGEFILLDRVETAKVLASLHIGSVVKDLYFHDTKSIEIVPGSKATGVVVKSQSGTCHRFVSMDAKELKKMKKAFQRFKYG